MDDQRKEEQEYQGTAVDKAVNDEDNNVDEQGTAVENMGTDEGLSQDFAENVGNSVETSEDSVNNSVDRDRETVQSFVEKETDNEDTVEETVDNVDNIALDVENEGDFEKKDKGVWWKVVLGVIAFAGVLGYCWFATGGGLWKTADLAITYLKDNGLYVYDLKNDPYIVNDSVTKGGVSNYYYSAWGANVSEDNGDIYYMAGVNEDSIGDLYYKDIENKDAKPILIGEKVYHFIRSADGNECAYLVKNGDKMDLYVFANRQSQKIDHDILLQNGAYELSNDGSYLLYKKNIGEKIALFSRTIGEKESVKLSDSSALSFISKKTNIAYYLGQKEDSYQLFQFTPGKQSRLIAEQVTYAELMPNDLDVLYCAMRTENAPVSQLIEDDITDLSSYDEKRQTQIKEIREKMNGKEGMDPIFQDCYLLNAGGNKVKLGETVISAVSLQGKGDYVGGFYMQAPEPVKLSKVSSFDEAMYSYYAALMYGQRGVFIADKTGKNYLLQDIKAVPNTIQVSPDGKTAAYFVQDETTGGNVLMVEALDGKSEPVQVQKAVEQMTFLGDSNTLVYYYDYNGGVGSLGMYKDGAPQEIEKNAVGVYFPEDKGEVYYMANTDTKTGNSALMKFDGKGKTEIDRDVFVFQYKENGKFAYLKNYNISTGIGDLYYYNGKTSRMVDTGVTAIYIY
ncbi:hypothetical protein [Anaerotignum sp.]|uniref:hypothetical protein n=1 Tax=Anaerotignum sp. TaxID=2039241 RepID=UPI0028A19F6B|nr:hypothetical protein [Anaerotignum sp.]